LFQNKKGGATMVVMKLRILYSVLVLLSFIIVPWWATGLLALIGIFLFELMYVESILFGVMLDSFYVPAEQFITVFLLPYMFTTVIILLLITSSPIKKSLRIYTNA
jgi:hypothetical protein